MTSILEHQKKPLIATMDSTGFARPSTPGCDDVLFAAVKSGDLDKVRKLLSSFGINCADTDGWTSLHHACYSGDLNLVRMLISEFRADITIETTGWHTPLHVAALAGEEGVAMALIREFGCSTNVMGWSNESVLHSACRGGNVNLVRTLIRDYKADPNADSRFDSTPLSEALLAGNEEVAMALIREFGCSTNVTSRSGESVLHSACKGGNVNLVRTLIRDYKADPNAESRFESSPLNEALLAGNEEVAMALVTEFGSSTRSALHSACRRGDVKLVRTLIHKYKADLNIQDNSNNTPLHVAVSEGNDEVAMALIELGCNIDFKGQWGKSVLHIACERENASLVRTLVCDYKADLNAQDDSNNTPWPLHVAVSACRYEVAVTLLELGCSTNVKGQSGKSALHLACERGSVSLVRTLVHDYKADLNSQDSSNNTPLHVAVSADEGEVAVALLELGCSTNVKGQSGKSALHLACERGSAGLVRTLVRDYKADLNSQDSSNNTPLHVAASSARREEVAMILIQEFCCRIDITNSSGESVLHSACGSGCTEVVTLISKSISPLVVDLDGNTPLHMCARSGQIGCIEALLQETNNPIFMRNKLGFSAMDLAVPRARLFLDKYTEENKDKIFSTYKALHISARKRYSKAEPITRIFVLGNPGAGKSSLIATLKKEGFFESIWRVTSDSVPLHTAGIIPSTYESRHYGRVLFYDFAGDPEYYSSHAAIFENLASSKIGQNIFIFVTDVTKGVDAINDTLGYWFSFIQYQKFDGRKSSLIAVGSHLDKIVSNADIEKTSKEFQLFFDSIRPNVFLNMKSFILDCCQPKSQHIKEFRSYISTLIRDSPQHSLSLPASVLLGLLEKDFSMVAACSVDRILSHIEVTGIPLPQNVSFLLPILQQLHDIGLLFLVRDSSQTSLQVVLNISKLTNEVHQLLFSDEAEIKRKNLPGLLQSLWEFLINTILTRFCRSISPRNASSIFNTAKKSVTEISAFLHHTSQLILPITLFFSFQPSVALPKVMCHGSRTLTSITALAG